MGPAIGSVMMLAFGPIAGILLNALFYLALVLWLWKAPYPPKFRKERPRTTPVRGLSEIWATMRAIADNRTIVSVTLPAGGAWLVVGNAYQAQMPEFAEPEPKASAAPYERERFFGLPTRFVLLAVRLRAGAAAFAINLLALAVARLCTGATAFSIIADTARSCSRRVGVNTRAGSSIIVWTSGR